MSNSLNVTIESKATRERTLKTLDVLLLPEIMIIGGTMRFFQTFKEGDVQDYNQQFIQLLKELRLDVQEKGVDLSDYSHNYLFRLREIGRAAYLSFLSEQARNHIVKLENEKLGTGLGFTFIADPSVSLFWEMLYAGDFEDDDDPVEPEQFWGFRYSLGRNFLDIQRCEVVFLQDGIFSIIHNELDFSKQEVEALALKLVEVSRSLNLNVALQLLDQIIPVEQLSPNALLKFFHRKEFEYGMIHFACHCKNPENAGATQAYLSMTSQEQEIEMTLEKLMARQDRGFVNRPFVFLNACASTTPNHLLETLSFPTGMLNFGAGGVIATACAVPDNFASAFANEFYRRLLNKLSIDAPVDIGDTLLKTRLHFLSQYNNPLGLAYGLYAVSNQQLSFERLV
jgi:hypothetical protein